MASCLGNSISSDENSLKHQLIVARNEISNLRQQIRALQHIHDKDVSYIKRVMEDWQNNGSSNRPITSPPNFPTSIQEGACKRLGPVITEDGDVVMKPIGYVSTWFPEKRGTPRQPGVSGGAQGKITLSSSVFTNPEHALEGLEEFSHMWILFYFHKNDSNHVRAKVAPPRLNGMRTGVFGTRSPHRPCPIGLSLVQIDRIEGGTVYFSGVDMIDQTPVMDLKPFIPQYDDPLHCEPALMNVDLECRLMVDGQESDDETQIVQPARSPARDAARVALRDAVRDATLIGQREAPDGEEGEPPALALLAPIADSPSGQTHAAPLVRVPRWITRPLVQPLEVVFSARAEAQLSIIKRDTDTAAETKSAIESVLHEDPRSAYLRQNWSNQFYTFLIAGLHVSCRFDDNAHTVSVFRINVAGKLCECGNLEWQCEQHGGTD